MKRSLLDSKTWKFFCSLKLAIVLASAVTLVVMGGSLSIPAHPRIFSAMDSMTLGAWLGTIAGKAPHLTWWVPAAALLLLLLWINTLCCFVDWALHLRTRWRRSGEYLIHLGFVLVLAAYLWGALAGFRSEDHRVFVGQTVPLPRPGLYLRLDNFEPVLNGAGRPVDMINTLTLLRGDRVIARARARTNHPLTWQGLAILPTSYGQDVAGFRTSPAGWPARPPALRTYSILTVNYDPGVSLALAGAMAMGSGVVVTLASFYRKRARGERPEVG